MNKKSQSGIVHFFVLAMLVAILLGIFGFVYWHIYSKKHNNESAQNATYAYKSWNTYNNPVYNFSFKYPKDLYSIKESANGSPYDASLYLGGLVSVYDKNKNTDYHTGGLVNVWIKHSKLTASDFAKSSGGKDIADGGPLIINGIAAYQVTRDLNGIRNKEVYFSNGSQIICLHLYLNNNEDSNYLPTFSEIYNSFKFN
ncbi:MAG: hypothetical protein WCP03_03525 [Candidatus Saccharibacteria bacterium]